MRNIIDEPTPNSLGVVRDEQPTLTQELQGPPEMISILTCFIKKFLLVF